jgi:hypothetical protein
MLEGLRTALAELLSFHALWTDMQPQLFFISTAADRRTLLSAAVLMVLAQHVYKINTWQELWNFEWPQPSVGGLSVAKSENI